MNNKKMICTLVKHVVTDEGDFIPAGMPVDVLQWANDDDQIYVRAYRYMYVDSINEETAEWSEHQGFIHDGLIIKTSPENLNFHSGF